MHRTITHILRPSTVLRVSLRQRQGLSFRLPAYLQSRQFSDATDVKLEKSPAEEVADNAARWSGIVGDSRVIQESSESSGESKTIFVGQLSWGIDSESLAQEFSQCGEIVSARIATDRNTGKSRGFGYVEFATTEAANAALGLNGKEIEGRTVNVDIASPKRPDPERRTKTHGDTANEPSTSLFVGNISFDVTEGELWEIFAEYGDVKNVRLPTDRETQRAKGFAFIEYNDVEAAQNAVDGARGREIGGRAIRLDFAAPRDESGGGRGGFGGGRRDDRGGRGGGDRGWGGRGRTGGGDRGGRGGGRGGGGGGRGYGGYSRD